MFRNFHGRTANDVWTAVASHFQTLDDCDIRDSRAGRIADLGNVCISITDTCQRWIVSREPAMNPAFALAEVIWIMAGRNDSRFLNYFNHQLPCFAGNHAEYPGAYGFRLRNSLGFDQLDRAFTALSTNEHSRQVVLQIWDGSRDFPHIDGAPSSSDVPCNVVSMLKIRGSKLDWTQVLRSNDFFLGLPHNLVQFTTLHEIMSGWLGIACGDFHLVTDCLHVYERNLPIISNRAYSDAHPNTDVMRENKSASEEVFASLANSVDLIVRTHFSSSQLLEHVAECQLTTPYKNMLIVLVAEGLRRRKETQLAFELMASCTNPAFVQMWNRWTDRLSHVTCRDLPSLAVHEAVM